MEGFICEWHSGGDPEDHDENTFSSSLAERFGASRESPIPARLSVELLPRGKKDPHTALSLIVRP